jgi:hypothetical protein
MRHRRREATARDSNSPKAHRREGYLATVQIKPVKYNLLRCTFSELAFSCCDSVAALRQRPGHHNQLPAKNNERRRGQRPGAAMKYLRRTTSAATVNGLGTIINEHSPAMQNKRRRGERPGRHNI